MSSGSDSCAQGQGQREKERGGDLATVFFLVKGVVHAWVAQIVTFFETAALAAPWAP